MDFLNYIDHHLNPISQEKIADICGVTPRTVRNWISGRTTPKRAHLELLKLHLKGRVMPPKWPHGWTINERGYLDIGHSKALSWQHLDWYFYSITLWQNTLQRIPEIEARIDALMRTAPQAVVIDLQKYKDELAALKHRPFFLPDDLREFYQIGEKETSRKFGC